jgi:hypothetical protein
MNSKYATVALLAVTSMVVPMLAMGQTMYRCGNNYQDTPCQNGEPMTRIRKGSAPQAAQAQTVDAECGDRGQDALKVVWAREAGATLEKQISEIDGKALSSAKAAERRQLIASVYQKRGSAPSIRSQIEAECLAEKEKLRQIQALATAAAKLTDELPSSARPTNSVASEQKPAEARRVTAQGNADAGHARACARLNSSLESVRKEQRAGGDAATMDSLRDKARQLDASLRSEGC